MVTLQLAYVWAGASVLATLLTCVLAASSEAAFLKAINGDALTANTTSVVLDFWYHFTNTSQAETVPPVEPDTFLGEIDVLDVIVTTTSDPNSTLIGRERAALFFERTGYENKVTAVFNNNSGLPANSSIDIEGFEPNIFPPEGYNYTVVGGTEALACARGVNTDILIYYNETAGTALVHDIVHLVVGCGFDRSNAFYLFFGSP